MPAAAGARGRSHAAAGGGDGNGAASAAVDPSGSANKPPMWTSTVSGAALGIALILLGCCANVMTLEILTTRDPGAGNLITFAQFLLIASEGVVNHWQWPFGLQPRVVPLSTYAKITAVFFLTSILNNKALDFQISIPVHTVFRSSGLCATLLLGRFAYHLRYPRHQVLACLLVTTGILAVTVMDAGKGKRAASGAAVSSCCGDQSAGSANNDTLLNSTGDSDMSSAAANATSIAGSVTEQLSSNLTWGTGIAMLTTSLFLAAYLGHEQDRTYKKYGKAVWKEVMFYSHLLALPAFTFVAPDILRHIRLLASLPPAQLPLPFLPSLSPLAPPLLLVLLLNILFQSVCIRGVYLLTTNSNTLTCNLLLTLRKLLSLLLSVTYFGNSFSGWQWAGSVTVFAGVLVYSQNPFAGQRAWAAMIKSPAASENSTPEKRQRKLAAGVKAGVTADEELEQALEEKIDDGVRRRVKAR